MEKQRRKRIAKRLTQVGQEDYSWDYWDTSKDDFYPVSEVGQAARTFVQCSTRMFYETFGKESGCNNNMRCHFRRDGKSKKPFDSLDEARSACARLWDKNEGMRPYKCRFCNKYHIGHKNGVGDPVPYKVYKAGEVLGVVVDLIFVLKDLFNNDHS